MCQEVFRYRYCAPLRQHSVRNVPIHQMFFAKSARRSRRDRVRRGKSSDREKEIQQRTVSQELCLFKASEARNINYKLAAHIIAIFSRYSADAKGRHIAVATSMWRMKQTTRVVSQHGIFYAKPPDLYLRILRTYLEIEYNVYLSEYSFLTRDNLSRSIPPARAISLSFRLVAVFNTDTLIYRAGPSMRKRISDMK